MFSQIWQAALNTLNPNPTDSCPLYLNHATVAALPSRVSRHNSPSSAHFVSRLVRSCLPGGNNRCIIVSILIGHVFVIAFHITIDLCLREFFFFFVYSFPFQMVCERSDVFASSCAIARAFPIFSRRSSSSRRTEKKHVTVEFVILGQDSSSLDAAEVEVNCCDPFSFNYQIILEHLYHSWMRLLYLVSLQRCWWSAAGSSHCGHTLQWDEHRSLLRRKWNCSY